MKAINETVSEEFCRLFFNTVIVMFLRNQCFRNCSDNDLVGEDVFCLRYEAFDRIKEEIIERMKEEGYIK
jgi:hypothetical protein